MTDIHISSPSWKTVWWAAGCDFAYLPPVDPEFAALPPLRRLLLRAFVLPLSYHRRRYAWVAQDERRPVAYLFARPRGKILMLESLGVAPEHRRKGLGRLLAERAARAAGEGGLPFVGGSVTPRNAAALGFFRALGYRPHRLLRWTSDAPPQTDSGHNVRIAELPAASTLPAYERWQKRAVKSGAAWAAEALLEQPFLRREWKGYARHWLCYRGERESGYLRIAGIGGRYRAYLACRVADLDDEAPLRWLHAALASYQSAFRRLDLDLPTAAHEEAAAPLLEAAGLRPLERPRLLLLRPAH